MLIINYNVGMEARALPFGQNGQLDGLDGFV